MADRLREVFDIEPTMVKGSGGVFDVVVDGELVYSKRQTGRFPEHAEIVALLNARAAQ